MPYARRPLPGALALGVLALAFTLAAPLRAQSRPIVGRAVSAAGRPLPGVRIHFYGFSRAGQRTSVDARTDAAGRFALRNLAPGRYSIRSANSDLRFDGEQYRLPLYLVGEDAAQADIGTDTGATLNLVLRTSGKISARKPDADENAYFGGFLVLDARREVDGEFLPADPSKSIVLRLVPDGPLMDGTAGKPLVFAKRLTARRADRVVLDVPLGVYRATAVLRGADGREQPMLLAPREMRSSAERAEPAAEAHIRFAPKEGDVSLLNVGGTEGVDLQLVADDRAVAAAAPPRPAPPVEKGEVAAAPAPAPAPAPVGHRYEFAVGQRVLVQGTMSESPGTVVGPVEGSASRYYVIFDDYQVWEAEERQMRAAGDDVAPPPPPPASYDVGEIVEWRRYVDQWEPVTIAAANDPVPGIYTVRFSNGATKKRVRLVDLRPAR